LLIPPKKKNKFSRSKLSSGSSKNSKKKAIVLKDPSEMEESKENSYRSVPSSKSSKKDVRQTELATRIPTIPELNKKGSNSSLNAAPTLLKDTFAKSRFSDVRNDVETVKIVKSKNKSSIFVGGKIYKLERKQD